MRSSATSAELLLIYSPQLCSAVIRPAMNSKYAAVILYVSVCLFLTFLLTSCGGVSAGNNSGNPSTPVTIAAVTPATATLAPGATQQFQTAVSGAANTAVVWQVNGVAGGAAQSGTISASGL